MQHRETTEAPDFREICAAEDLSRLGLIQPHGCLIGVDGQGRVKAASENAKAFLGKDWNDVLGADAASISLQQGETLQQWIARNPTATDSLVHARCRRVDGADLDVFGHRSGDLTIVELVIPGGAEADDRLDIAGDLAAIQDSLNAYGAAAAAAKAIRRLSGYDRVMIYRFLPDFSGDVIAEDRQDDLTPYLGLRYPATDIPVNARQLYLRAPIRVLVDAKASPARVRVLDGADCDLGLARLRSVSQYHIEYLNNMGVLGTLVTSIIVGGKLWGLVSCHHGHAFSPPGDVQAGCEKITRALAEKIEFFNKKDEERREGLIEEKVSDFLHELSHKKLLWRTILFGKSRLIRSLEIDGCAVRIDDEMFSIGYCPPLEKIWNIEDVAASRSREEPETGGVRIWSCINIKSIVGAFEGNTAGVAICVVSEAPYVSLLLFRNEQKQEVYWGGNPDKSVDVDPDNMRVSPRKSFERWTAEVTDCAAEWEPVELGVLAELSRRLKQERTFDLQATVALPGGNEDHFRDIVFNRERTEVQTILDDFVPDGIATLAFETSPTPRLIDGYANAAFCSLFGLSRSETVEQDTQNVMKLAGLSPSLLDLGSNVERHVDVMSPRTGQRAMKVRRLDLICRQFRDGGAEGLSVLYLHDETERRRIIDAFDVARRQNRANTRFKAEILGGLSHELRTPLNAIIGYAEALSLGVVKDQEATKEYIGTILDAGRQMVGLIDGLLDVARLERGMLEINEAPFLVANELEATVRIAREHASSHAQTIELTLSPEPVEFLGDAQAFRQIVLNLLSNAVKFSPSGGRIHVSAERSQLNSLVLQVADSGPGIPTTHRSRIFEPFAQIEDIEVQSRPGVGIGLSIVKAYTELHGGTIAIDDSPLGGAVFTLRFPSWRVITDPERPN